MTTAGDILFGKYEVEALLGKGSFGTVYRVREQGTDAVLALKLLAATPTKADLAEAALLRQLDHPQIVRFFNFERDEADLAFVMEYMDGGSLAGLMDDGPLPPEGAVSLLVPICQGMAFAHSKNVIHRDLKPENILLNTQGQVKVGDFGVARALEEKQAASTIIGTPSYMAPEQFKGKYGLAVDVYALGCILYHLVAGRPPFTGSIGEVTLAHMTESPVVPSDWPAPLRDLLQSCLAKSPPAARPTRARCCCALRNWNEPPPTPTRPTWSNARRRPHANRPPTGQSPPAGSGPGRSGPEQSRELVARSEAFMEEGEFDKARRYLDLAKEADGDLIAYAGRVDRLEVLEKAWPHRAEAEQRLADNRLNDAESALSKFRVVEGGKAVWAADFERRLATARVRAEEARKEKERQRLEEEERQKEEHEKQLAERAETVARQRERFAEAERLLNDARQMGDDDGIAEAIRVAREAREMNAGTGQYHFQSFEYTVEAARKSLEQERRASKNLRITGGVALVVIPFLAAIVVLTYFDPVAWFQGKASEPRQAADAPISPAAIPEPEPPPAAGEASRTANTIRFLLAEADKRIAENKLTKPNGDNAYETYRKVLSVDPDNQAAKAGLDRIEKQYLEWGDAKRDASDYSTAAKHYERALLVNPDGVAKDRLAELETRENASGATWTDPATRLMWQAKPTGGWIDGSEAQSHCENLMLTGFRDWRLPTISELRSLIRGCPDTQVNGACGVTSSCRTHECWNRSCRGCAHGQGPGSGGAYWPSQLSGLVVFYWSSSILPDLDTMEYSWNVRFDKGMVDFFTVAGNTAYVRCVRDAR